MISRVDKLLPSAGEQALQYIFVNSEILAFEKWEHKTLRLCQRPFLEDDFEHLLSR